MLLTRVGFLKLLAAVGIGQATRTQPTQPSSDVLIQTGPLSDPATQCLKPSLDHRGWEFTKCNADCENGEEKCPLGHCQKPSAYLEPKPIWGKGGREGTEMTGLTMMYYEPGKWIAQHVCSTCGIVYILLK